VCSESSWFIAAITGAYLGVMVHVHSPASNIECPKFDDDWRWLHGNNYDQVHGGQVHTNRHSNSLSVRKVGCVRLAVMLHVWFGRVSHIGCSLYSSHIETKTAHAPEQLSRQAPESRIDSRLLSDMLFWVPGYMCSAFNRGSSSINAETHMNPGTHPGHSRHER